MSVVDKNACSYTTPVSVEITAGEPSNSRTATALLLPAGETIRLEVSSRDSKLILILIEAPTPAEFSALEPLAARILGSLRFPA